MKKLAVIISILMAFSNICISKTLHVPSEYSTIQAAINSSRNFDTVLVSEGTYYENIKYNGKNIVVASRYIFTKDWQTVQNTIINGSKPTRPDSGSCVAFNNKEDSNAVLEGFTLTGGSGTKYNFTFGPYQEGGGVILHYSSAVIRNNIITNNYIVAASGAQRGGGGGIASMYGNPTIYNNVIVSNNSGYAGGIVLNWSSGKIYNNIIYHNTGGADYGTGGVMIWQPPDHTVYVKNNTVVGNISLKDAGGININSTTSVVENNIVWGNRQVSGKQVSNPQYGRYNDIEDYSSGTNISVNPQLLENSFLLGNNSPCIDAGDTSSTYNDLADPNNSGSALFPSKGNLRNDIGAFGGSFAGILPLLNVHDLYFTHKLTIIGKAGEEGSIKIAVLNLSSGKIKIDSVCDMNKTLCSIASNLNGKEFNAFENDSIYISYKISTSGTFYDTVFIYHRAADLESPVKIVLTFNIKAVTGLKEKEANPNEFKLYQCYPNPFNPSTTIRFKLPAAVHVTLKIYDILGNEISVLVNTKMNPGLHEVTWHPGTKISSGVYLINIAAGRFSGTNKIIYQK